MIAGNREEPVRAATKWIKALWIAALLLLPGFAAQAQLEPDDDAHSSYLGCHRECRADHRECAHTAIDDKRACLRSCREGLAETISRVREMCDEEGIGQDECAELLREAASGATQGCRAECRAASVEARNQCADALRECRPACGEPDDPCVATCRDQTAGCRAERAEDIEACREALRADLDVCRDVDGHDEARACGRAAHDASRACLQELRSASSCGGEMATCLVACRGD